MFSLSTAWNYQRHTSGRSMIDEIRAAGFSSVELNFALTRSIVEEIADMVDARLITVTSLHNMCPLPDEIPPDKASPDYYNLASRDDTERAKAVAAARTTVDWAARLHARAVVLHAGRIPLSDRTRKLAAAIDTPAAAEALRTEMQRERLANSYNHIEQAIRSLEELAPYAARKMIDLGIENRYYYREIPSVSEIDSILRHFRDRNVYYWHDVGHAEAFERLGLIRHEDLMDRFSNRLLGIHLHDIIGPMDDHRAPGCGTFDFARVARYIKAGTIRVIEAHAPATAGELAAAVALLTRTFDHDRDKTSGR